MASETVELWNFSQLLLIQQVVSMDDWCHRNGCSNFSERVMLSGPASHWLQFNQSLPINSIGPRRAHLAFLCNTAQNDSGVLHYLQNICLDIKENYDFALNESLFFIITHFNSLIYYFSIISPLLRIFAIAPAEGRGQAPLQ